ncbi:hypothetical protein DPMN_086426 [Dreissena polymorpha]|uniref:Uncharacterized protein n=1 Tax=Dreissena polymorpha TaxID=45954 RepID=A0A9D4QUK0_DREPO|nr:hypothetical protein DPMN_086426 [Dreissena polymorpha]
MTMQWFDPHCGSIFIPPQKTPCIGSTREMDLSVSIIPGLWIEHNLIGFNLSKAGDIVCSQKSPLFHNSLGDREKLEGGPAPTSGQKQEMKLGVAVVPRKGLIALSTSDDTSDTGRGRQSIAFCFLKILL